MYPAFMYITNKSNKSALLTAMLAYVRGANAWVGLSQGVTTPNLRWVDGREMEYRKWAHSQPTGPILVPEYVS